MQSYIIGRLAMLPITLLVASVLTFVFLRIVPGDAAVARAGLGATPEAVEQLRQEMGLDKPYFPIELESSWPFTSFHRDSQFTDWFYDAIRFDFGTSTTYNTAVRSEIIDRIPVTLELVLLATFLTIVVGVPAGTLSAIRQNTPLDALVRTISVFGISIPGFFLGTIFLLFPSIWWQWAPPARFENIWVDPVKNLQMFILPSVALAAAYMATVMRLTRSAMLDVLRSDFVRTAWSKGLGERQVMWHHALKNAMTPIVTYVGLQIITMTTGAVIIEQVFNLNGVGRLLFTSIFSRDYAMVQARVLFFAAIVLLVNLTVDLICGLMDPRVSYG
jgi:peptide/nickel transport system permease protein